MQVTLTASDLDGYLRQEDRSAIESMGAKYAQVMHAFAADPACPQSTQDVIAGFDAIGSLMQETLAAEPRVHVYSFETPESSHGEASRLIAKLRDVATLRPEYTYYVQRAYELLFNLVAGRTYQKNKNYIIVRTPVDLPLANYAVHKIPNVDEFFARSVMCVMLRGALLPSMIMSKEIQEYSTSGYVTPFALFRIYRDDAKQEHTMEYTLDLDRSYFDLAALDGKDLYFADPMNATGGSLVTVVKYLLEQGVVPRSVKCLNIIAVLKGALRIVRAIENSEVYTIWMDPALNSKAYILPGLGDAGDRINGADDDRHPRGIIQLISDYGANTSALYRSQVREIEKTVLT